MHVMHCNNLTIPSIAVFYHCVFELGYIRLNKTRSNLAESALHSAAALEVTSSIKASFFLPL